MNDLETELRQVAFSEPPLGFDPDDVATKAAKRLRTRRATIATAGVTLALAGVAVAALTPLNRTPAATQEPPTYLPPVVILKPLPRDQSWLEQVNTARLQRELPLLIPGMRTVVIDGFLTAGGELRPDEMSATVALVDYEGKGHSFTVDIMGPVTVAKSLTPLAQACEHAAGRCDKVPRSDGSTVVIEERGAIHYRADATAVEMTETGEGAPALDDQRKITLVTEYGFHTR